MRQPVAPTRVADRRALKAVLDVLPRSIKTRESKRDSAVAVIVGNQRLEIKWVGEGNLGDVRRLLAIRGGRPDVVVGRRLSPGAREALSAEAIGWVDETGAAEIAFGSIIVSRTGHVAKPTQRPRRWTPAVVAVAEALLCGARGTVAATQAATGLSTGSCTNALRTLTDLGLLEAKSGRGRESARQLVDSEGLLRAYASAVEASPEPITLQIGVTWRDPVAGLMTSGEQWAKSKVLWAATGAAAASVIAPYLTAVTTTEVYVDADTILGLEAIAADAGMRPIEGGRLTLRPFPTVTVRRLAEIHDGLRVAPWPRVYVDLRRSGVRGEDAAEHLAEVIHAR